MAVVSKCQWIYGIDHSSRCRFSWKSCVHLQFVPIQSYFNDLQSVDIHIVMTSMARTTSLPWYYTPQYLVDFCWYLAMAASPVHQLMTSGHTIVPAEHIDMLSLWLVHWSGTYCQTKPSCWQIQLQTLYDNVLVYIQQISSSMAMCYINSLTYLQCFRKEVPDTCLSTTTELMAIKDDILFTECWLSGACQ